MYTVAETEIFQKSVRDIWSEEERHEFITWIAQNPMSGDVIEESGGLRKVRWKRKGTGKSGGVRVIYYNLLEDGKIWLLIGYAKSKFDNLPTTFLKTLREAIHG